MVLEPCHSIYQQFSQVVFKDYKLSVTSPDNCCFLKRGSIVVIKNILKIETDYFIVGSEFESKKDFCNKPSTSSILMIYKVEDESELKMWSITEIAFKYIKLSFQNYHIVIPILHSLC